MVGIIYIYIIDIPLTYTGRTYHISTDNVKKINELRNKKHFFQLFILPFPKYLFFKYTKYHAMHIQMSFTNTFRHNTFI